MSALLSRTAARDLPQIECGTCEQKLPLRLTVGDEPAAVWRCAKCNVPYVACCVKKSLLTGASSVRLDERFFDVSDQRPISLLERQQAVKLASRPISPEHAEQRRSKRVAKSLVVPAIRLGHGLAPEGEPFQIMVSNLSREGVGLIHDEWITSDYIAIEFSPDSQSPIQVIVDLVRQRELTPPYYELGGEFLVRLGSLPVH